MLFIQDFYVSGVFCMVRQYFTFDLRSIEQLD